MNNGNLPHVAVLLAAYDGERWIGEQLESIEQQRGVRVSVYISVDEGRDGTQRWCEAYAASRPHVHVLPSGRFGGAGRNFFRLLRDVAPQGHDFLAFADQDDHWLPGKLERAIACLQQHQAAGYSSNVLAFWPDGREVLLDKAQAQVRWDHLFEAAGPGCTYVWTASMGQALQAFVRQHWQAVQQVTLHDWLTYAFAREQGWRWYIDPQPGVMYRQHERNQIGANVSVRSMLARLRMIRDGWWFGQVARIAALLLPPRAAPVAPALARRHVARMLLQSRQCRRRPRDRWLFAALCLCALVFGVRQ